MSQKEFRLWVAKLSLEKEKEWTSSSKLDWNFGRLFEYVLLLKREIEFSNLISLRSNKKLDKIPATKDLLLSFDVSSETKKKKTKKKITGKSIWYSIFGLKENGDNRSSQ